MVGWFILLAASCAAGAEQVGSVAGRLVDSEGAAIGRASVVLTEQSNSAVRYETATNSSGDFSFASAVPGVYTVTIEAPGFLDRTIPDIRVNSAEAQNLKHVALKIAGCYAPGVNCDCFGPCPVTVRAEGTETVPFGCGVDADRGKMICGMSDRMVDFRVRAGNSDEIYLTAARGSKIVLDPLGQWTKSDCVNARYSASDVRVDQLKHHDRVCVLTNSGRYAQVYGFSKSDDGSVRLAYLTWR